MVHSQIRDTVAQDDFTTPAPLIRVAQYVRMSTEYQKYSTANQSDANHAYAHSRGMQIVRTYADEGRSGLSIGRRNALLQLIKDVQSGKADFEAILVYDVTRWGRFQNVDESAHYEYICKSAGVNVHYCAEQFENDGSPLSAIVKSIKRAMAGEYSRELSTKVFVGHARLIKLGYRQGGPAGYGLRRFLVDQNGVPKGILQRGQNKSISTDRVVIIPGPPNEIEVVRWIFRSFVKKRVLETEIARILNRRKILNAKGSQWHFRQVRTLLLNENYIGNNVWNRHSKKLGAKDTTNQPDEWIRADGVFEAIVDPTMFNAARAIIRDSLDVHSLSNVRRKATQKAKDDQLLDGLRLLYQSKGYLTRRVIDASPDVPRADTFCRRFGGMKQAYALVGFTIPFWPAAGHRRTRRSPNKATRQWSEQKLLDALRHLLHRYGFITKRMIDDAEGIPHSSTYAIRFGNLTRAYRLVGFRQHLWRRPRPNDNFERKNAQEDSRKTKPSSLRQRGPATNSNARGREAAPAPRMKL
jgi:DNA invertase Pin-like site-specific DNA recombinase